MLIRASISRMDTVPTTTAQVTQRLRANEMRWRRKSRRQFWTNLLLGGASVVLCSLYGTNAVIDKKFLPVPIPAVFGIAAALISFVLTTLKPSAGWAAYAGAARIADKAIREIEADDTMTIKDLIREENRAIDLLGGLNLE